MVNEDDDLAGTPTPAAKKVRELNPIVFDRPGERGARDFRPLPVPEVPTPPPVMVLPEDGMEIAPVHPSVLPPT